ncbi:hypothetical protein TNCV_3599061 [Trichonephila clavipes]|nr:hypothetical protein TNCV_3599061 [Trichonephila clavipes]
MAFIYTIVIPHKRRTCAKQWATVTQSIKTIQSNRENRNFNQSNPTQPIRSAAFQSSNAVISVEAKMECFGTRNLALFPTNGPFHLSFGAVLCMGGCETFRRFGTPNSSIETGAMELQNRIPIRGNGAYYSQVSLKAILF